MSATLIVNASSGRGAAVRTAGAAAEVLRTALPELRVLATVDTRATTALAADAVLRGDDVVAVLGGDGTVHHAVQALAGTGTALAVLPGGTGNDLAAALGVPAGPVPAARHAVRALQQGRRRSIDLGRTGDGTWFGTVLCTGFDAAVSARANALRWPSGPRRYKLAVLAELARLASRPVRIRTAGDEHTRPATLVAVGNTPSYGGGLRICPQAQVDDGLLSVTTVGTVSRRRLLRVFPALRTGSHVGEPEVRTMETASVALDGPVGWPVYADGEPMCALPVTVECVPGALTVLA